MGGVATTSESEAPVAVELRGKIAQVRAGALARPTRAAGVLPGLAAHRQLTLGTDDADHALEVSLVTHGIDLAALGEGRRLRAGATAVLQVTHRIVSSTGTAWVARVLRDGTVTVGDDIGTDATFDAPRFAVVTLSDRAASGTRADESGALAASILESAIGGTLVSRDVMADDAAALQARLIELCDELVCDLVVTTGGTGLAPRDVTPEATLAVIDREVPGIAEAIRAGGLRKTPHAMLSRGVCGQRGSTLIVNLSGSPRAVREQLEILLPVLPHVLTTASGVSQDCAGLGSR